MRNTRRGTGTSSLNNGWLDDWDGLILLGALAYIAGGMTTGGSLSLTGISETTVLWVGLGTCAFLALGITLIVLDYKLRALANRRRRELNLSETPSSSRSSRFFKGALNLRALLIELRITFPYM